MTRRRLLWITPTAIWLLFTFWYTDFGGPLTDEEIAVGIEKVRSQGYGAQQISDLEAFLKSDTGRQFLMVNNIDMNDNPPQMPGFGPDATASDYVNHYMAHMFPQLLKRACHPIFMGAGLSYDNDVAGVGEAAASGWDTAALFRYRSRRSLLEVIAHADTQGRHEYKIAAMVKTITYAVEPRLYVSDLRFILLLVFGLVTALADILFFGRSTNTRVANPQ
jgi:hypothetical protein